MTIERNQGGGARQRAWNALRERRWPSVEALAQHVGCASAGLRHYVGGLQHHGYVRRNDAGEVELIRDTGPRSPAFSIHTGAFRDWNLEPTMSAVELRDAIMLSGLTIREWLTAKGLDPQQQTRVRQMINGQRPVSSSIAKAVKAS